MGNVLAFFAIGAAIVKGVHDRREEEREWESAISDANRNAPVIVHDHALYVPLNPLLPANTLVHYPVSTTFPMRLVHVQDGTFDTVNVSRNALLFPVTLDVSSQKNAILRAQKNAQRTDRANAEYGNLAERKLATL